MIDILKEIKEFLALVIPMTIGMLILISKVTKNSKLRTLAENLIVVEKVIEENICNAEAFLNYSGEEKKEWVKTNVNRFCINHKIPFQDDIVDTSIERVIAITKSVNKREKDKENFL